MRVTKQSKNKMLEILEEVYHDTKTALHYETSFELLVAVILSAQCTDERVNVTTARIFPKYNTPQAMLALRQEQLEEQIKDCGLFRSKARNILAACAMLCEKYNGEIPNSFEGLIELPGVGRKTANVVLSVLFDVPAIAVDTHVFRVANRLGLAKGDTPRQVEEELMKIVPKKKWSEAHHWLIWHGRKVCKARNPLCANCMLGELCPSLIANIRIRQE